MNKSLKNTECFLFMGMWEKKKYSELLLQSPALV